MHGIYLVIGPDRGEITWWQMTARGALTFVYGLALVRVAGVRAFSLQSSLDIMLSILIGSNLSRALTQGSPYFPTLAATAGIVLIYWLAIELAQRSDLVGLVLKGRAAVVARDGQVDTHVMRRGGISHLDLDAAIRRAHLPNLEAVALATLERNGQISVVPVRK
jgi:uncharacterized membrane protein YcaP (DUF421 family)